MYDSWQYGIGSHASAAKRILGSVEILVQSDNGQLISIRHLLISGSSNWVIGRNVTKPCNLEHIGKCNQVAWSRRSYLHGR